MTRRVLILCTTNAARSQMAEGLWRCLDSSWDVASAGSQPLGSVHPLAIEAMSEVDIDISQQACRGLDQLRDQEFDLLVTVSEEATMNCLDRTTARHCRHWPLDDPTQVEGDHEDRLNAFRAARDELDARIREFLDRDSEELSKFVDRDLSWLEFNRRVLHEATDTRTPLLERLMFLGIFTSNLDEFFMKRVGRLLGDPTERANRKPQKGRLAAIRHSVTSMLAEQARVFRNEIRPALAEQDIHLLLWEQMKEEERAEANRYFRRNVFPVLTPQAVDPSHPFPFISNLSDSLAIALRHPDGGGRLFARVKVPHQLPQWIDLECEGETKRFASLREIILNNLEHLFPRMIVEDVLPMRVTRGAQVDVEHVDSEDLLEQVEEELRQRRMQYVVRLEHTAKPNRWLLDQVVHELQLAPQQVFEVPGELDYTDFMSIASLPIPKLRYSSWTPQPPREFSNDGEDIFTAIRRGDVLVHHPYESFDASVARFIRSAVNDDDVLAIKITLYRTSDDTPFIPWLIKAAEDGKQVVCLVELKARFDEHRNIRWANALEGAGVHVVYGVIGKKTHTKTALVVRRESDGLRCYSHIGTGNYHPKTAKLYTDLGLFTCEHALTEDVVELFHFLTGLSLKDDYQKLLVAPVNMKARFLEMIERETAQQQAGRPSGILAKMNQLEDRDICRALYRASQAGVPIDLIIRGFCVLRPGVPELSPTIRVISVIGRFLEHSRVYCFRNGAEHGWQGEYFIGSADWMHRNLEERVEAIAPVQNGDLRRELWDILQLMLSDQRQAWDMRADGSYEQRAPIDGGDDPGSLGTHEALMRHSR